MKDVKFGLSRKPDPDSSGIHTSVAINNKGEIIEVHRSEGASSSLWYRNGQTDQMDVRWNKSQNLANDNGKRPSVCMNDKGTVVEVHKSQSWSTLWYHVAKIDGNQLNWGSSHKYDSGILPSIAIDNDGWCIEVHSSEGFAAGLWYRLGIVNTKNKTIEWLFDGAKQYDKGFRPRVAINNEEVVVEVHNSEGIHNTLWYTVGTLDKQGKTIHWGNHTKYGNGGTQPSVAITDGGFVIETHRSQSQGTLWRHIGKLNVEHKTIDWSDSAYFDDGNAPSVACTSDGAMAIQTHESENFNTLWYSTSLITDRRRWMEILYDHLKDRRLWQISLPGSHDTGAYDMSTTRTPCGDAPGWIDPLTVRRYATTHTLDMKGQLNNGARFFDLRPYKKEDGKFYAYHDVIGASFENILDNIHSFLQNTNKELVVLKISHFCEFNDGQHKELSKLIRDKIGKYLYKQAELLTTPLQQLIQGGSKAIVWYDADFSSFPEDFYSEINIYDQYSKSDNYQIMRADQLKKMKNHPGTAQRIFLLSWTLTFTDWKSVFKGVSLHVITKKANRHLGEFLATKSGGYQINIVYVDFLEDARVTDCVISLNQQQRFKSTLVNDEYLSVGQQLVSPNGKYALILQGDGNLVLYKDGYFRWNSGTNGKSVTKAIQQTDGNWLWDIKGHL